MSVEASQPLEDQARAVLPHGTEAPGRPWDLEQMTSSMPSRLAQAELSMRPETSLVRARLVRTVLHSGMEAHGPR